MIVLGYFIIKLFDWLNVRLIVYSEMSMYDKLLLVGMEFFRECLFFGFLLCLGIERGVGLLFGMLLVCLVNFVFVFWRLSFEIMGLCFLG